MKQLIKTLIFSLILVFALQSCYDDYLSDYEYTAVYFAVQNPLRTVIVEESDDLSIEIGVVLGGKYFNDKNETVEYKVVPELLNDYPQFTLLPESYYSLTNSSEITIPSGKFLGTVELNLNESFVQDGNAHDLHYAIPVQIVSASTDSVLENKDYSIIAINYHNKYYGGYWIKGVDNTLNAADEVVDTYRYTNPDLTSNNYTIFSTQAADSSIISYVGLDISGNNKMKIAINDGNVNILNGGSSEVSEVSGSGTYDASAKKFYLDYVYEKAGEKHQVKDTLIWFAYPQSLETWN